MTEREMRDLVATVLRKSLRQVVLPAALGVGLSLAGCGSSTSSPDTVPWATPAYAAPRPDGGRLDGRSVEKYGAPFTDAGQAVTKYMAPFDAGRANPAYAAPAPDAGQASMKYMAPFPDSRS